jgi:hypothetical protein
MAISLPTLSLRGAFSIIEGTGGAKPLKFTASLSQAATQTVSFDVLTQDGTATAGNDYTRLSQPLHIPAGQSSVDFFVQILGDAQVEANENFRVELSKLSNAVFSNQQATLSASAQIRDDDLPIVQMKDVRVNEGQQGSKDVDILVSLSTAASREVHLHYQTLDQSAEANSDYLPQEGDLVIPVGAVEYHIKIPILGDTTPEATQSFQVRLSQPVGAQFQNSAPTLSSTVAILNDDRPLPTLAINVPRTVDEGGQDETTDLRLTFSLSSTPANGARLHYETVDNLATANSDYESASGEIIFDPGEREAALTLLVLGDIDPEGDETFILRLSDPENLSLNDRLPTQDLIRPSTTTNPPRRNTLKAPTAMTP